MKIMCFDIDGCLRKFVCLVGVLAYSSMLQGAPFAFVANYASDNVMVIDLATNSVIATTDVGNRPLLLNLSRDGSTVWVTHEDLTVHLIDADSYANIGTEILDDDLFFQQVQSQWLSPDLTRSYVVDPARDIVTVNDVATANELAAVDVGSNPIDAVVTRDGSRVYITNFDSHDVSVLDTSSNTVVDTIDVRLKPVGITSSPDGSRIYVVSQTAATVSVIDTSTNSVITEIPVGRDPFYVTINSDGTFIYVTNFSDNSVSVIDTASNTVITEIPTGTSPVGILIIGADILMSGLWWNASESGWGVNLIRQFGIVFVTMFTYDSAGLPVWYVASNCEVSGEGCSGELYKVTAGSELTEDWNGDNLNVDPVGTISFLFTGRNDGTMTFEINGVSGTKVIERQIWATQ